MSAEDRVSGISDGPTLVGRAAAARDVAIVLAAGLLPRLWLIHRFPVIFGEDPIARLVHADRVFLSYDLPLLQLAIHGLHAVSTDPLVVRYFIALVGAVAGVGFYLFLADLLPRRVALGGGLLFASQPFILANSVVPYQEVLMVAGLLYGFHFAYTGRWVWASVALGLACLTRYEAWVACPVVALVFLRRSGISLRTLSVAAVLFGWAPLAWIAYNRGVTPAGSYAAEWSANPERLIRWAHVGVLTLRFSPLPALLLAGLGAWVLWRRRLWASEGWGMGIAFLALFLVAILFSSHGMGEDPERVVTEREVELPLVGVTALAALGLAGLPRFRASVVALSAVWGLWMATRFIQAATSDPHLALSYQVAQDLDREVGAGEEVVVLAREFSAEDYLGHVERLGGRDAVRAALRWLESASPLPRDYARILVASRLGADRLRTVGTLPLGRFADSLVLPTPVIAERARPDPQWLVVWSDFAPANATEVRLATKAQASEPRQVFTQGGVSVRVYALGR